MFTWVGDIASDSLLSLSGGNIKRIQLSSTDTQDSPIKWEIILAIALVLLVQQKE